MKPVHLHYNVLDSDVLITGAGGSGVVVIVVKVVAELLQLLLMLLLLLALLLLEGPCGLFMLFENEQELTAFINSASFFTFCLRWILL